MFVKTERVARKTNGIVTVMKSNAESRGNRDEGRKDIRLSEIVREIMAFPSFSAHRVSPSHGSILGTLRFKEIVRGSLWRWYGAGTLVESGFHAHVGGRGQVGWPDWRLGRLVFLLR